MAPTLSSLKYLKQLLEKNKDKQVVKNKKKFIRCMKVSISCMNHIFPCDFQTYINYNCM